MEGPSMARKSGCKGLKVRQAGEEKKGVSPGDGRLHDAVIWGLLKSHLSASLSRRGRERGDGAATVAGPNYPIAFLLLHGGLYRPG